MLYLLPLKNREAFKFGISLSGDDCKSRIKNLCKNYDFQLSEAYLIKSSSEKTIKQLERQIKTDYAQYSYDTKSKCDGYTEFLNYETLSKILEEIGFKSRLSHLNISINKGVVLSTNNAKNVCTYKLRWDSLQFTPQNDTETLLTLLKKSKQEIKFEHTSSGCYILTNKRTAKAIYDMRNIEEEFESTSILTSKIELRHQDVAKIKIAPISKDTERIYNYISQIISKNN